MTYQEFKNKYNGKYIDFDGYYGAQCWDLAQFYFTEVLNLPKSILSGCGNVKNMLKQPKLNVLLTYFDEIDVHTMKPGDVCIWTTNHIAIFDHWNGHNNYFFSQNPNKCQVMPINMIGLHAFRKKGKETIVKFPKYTGKSKSLVDALKSLKIDSSYSYRSKIASKNGITGYRGTATQNTKLLTLLKQGSLIKP